MPPSHPSAGKSVTAWIVFLLVLAGGLAGDLASKYAVFNWVRAVAPETGSRVIIPGVVRFTLRTNPGGAFGFSLLPPYLVVAATALATAFVLYFFITSHGRAYLIHVALGMILAGAVGNLYDRLFSAELVPGVGEQVRQVRDFIDFGKIYPWVFNVADILLVVGVAMLIFSSFLTWRRQRAAAKKS